MARAARIYGTNTSKYDGNDDEFLNSTPNTDGGGVRGVGGAGVSHYMTGLTDSGCTLEASTALHCPKKKNKRKNSKCQNLQSVEINSCEPQWRRTGMLGQRF